MAIIDEILDAFFNAKRNLAKKAFGPLKPKVISSREFQARLSQIKESTLRATLHRMERRGLVKRSHGGWLPTRSGSERHQKALRRQELRQRRHVEPVNMMVIFDIPELERGKRRWLRQELRNLGFFPIQLSVWHGPAPLPEEFIKDVIDKDLKEQVKFYKAVPEDLI